MIKTPPNPALTNAVALCPLCHRNCDSLDDPGLVFIPTDIKLLHRIRKRDFEGRKGRAAIHGHAPPRQTPTARNYLEHQINQAAILPDALDGLYNRYTLRDYFPVRMDRGFIHPTQPLDGELLPITRIRPSVAK